ncbi:MAG TPA: UDP-N-acetylmuramoyl-tripeptide--D-alanyl-D-alanine ligase, partial [Oxalobacteraceae bacterium]|nr:UDP-N-acetylmuramoyl-tripeptide--D-alanyl-D-alanine ligase [Oxalobacteraceae bacterium]
ADDPHTPLWRGYATGVGQRTVLTFGLSADADVSCSYQAGEFGSDMTVKTARRQFAVSLAAAGVHNVRNALAAIACT